MAVTAARLAITGLLAGLAASACGTPSVPLHESRATVGLSEPRRFYESGAGIPLAITVFNPGATTLAVGPGLADGAALEVVRVGGFPGHPVDSEPGVLVPDAGARSAPARDLSPQQRLIIDVDVAAIFPQLQAPGRYQLTAVFPQFRSNTIPLDILPAFDVGDDIRAELHTTKGVITLRFFADVAPQHVRNFVNLARLGFYDATYFHRISADRLIQGGDPTGTGTGGPGYTIKAEFNSRPHRAGTLSMARGAAPDSAGSQWFIALDRTPDWDGTYTVFGEVSGGLDVAVHISRRRAKDEVPVRPVTLERVIIRPATAAEAATAVGETTAD